MVNRRFKQPTGWLLALLWLCSTGLQAATITAKTDRMNITVDENFTLMFVIEGDMDKEPNFSPLKKDFDILGQSQGSTTTISNGYYKTATTYSLTMMAKRAGNLIIPSVAFGKDSSQILALSVGAGSSQNTADQPANLLLEVTPSRNSAWVQGQIILNVKLLSALNLRMYNISKIDIGKFDASIEELGEAKQSQTTRNGRNYLQIEQKFSIHPQQAGKLTIEPLIAEVNAVTQSRSLFDPFNTRGNILRARSQSITINVQNIPAEFTGKLWLPASDVQLVEEWSPNPPVFKVGEPVTRTLNLFADGLTSAQLPELRGKDIDGIKQYPDQPVLNNDKNSGGVIGGRREKIALIPTRPGNYTLPAIEIPWWNIKTGKTEIARIAEKTIQVLPGAGNTGKQLTDAIITDTESTEPQQLPQLTSNNSLLASPWLLWLCVFFATGWLLTASGWWYSVARNKPKSSKLKKSNANNSASKADIRQACESNNAQKCRRALLSWAKHNLSDDINSLGDVINHAEIQPHSLLVTELEKLNAALYRSHTPAWQGQKLWAEFLSLPTHKTPTQVIRKSKLEPLYK